MADNVLTRLLRLMMRNKASDEGCTSSPQSEVAPLTQLNIGLRELDVLLRGAATKIQAIEQQCRSLRLQSSEAWHERQELHSDYYAVIRGMLQLMDDCENTRQDATETSRVYEKLQMILQKQRIEVIPVKRGDRFDAQFQKCEEKVETVEYPPGCVVQVIEKGYVQRRRNAATVVIRPSRVCISQRSEQQ